MISAEINWLDVPAGEVELPDPKTLRFRVGQRIIHAGHSFGNIVALNKTKTGLYNGKDHPYEVKFDDGYSGMYGTWELSPCSLYAFKHSSDGSVISQVQEEKSNG
jgi:hypothetical protein